MNTSFYSNYEFFISIYPGINIYNDRDKMDCAYLDCLYWSAMKQGNDGYPTNEFNSYLIASGQDLSFRAKHIEIYGVKI